MKKNIFLLFLIPLLCAKSDLLVIDKSVELHIPEPSDICRSSNGGYFVVSDNGILYKLKSDYTVEQKSDKLGFDYEAVCANDSEVFVSDESLRQIAIYNASDLKLKSVKYFSYQGARNMGMESLTYDPIRKVFIGFTEKDPSLLLKFDESFKIISEIPVSGIREVSGITYYNNYLWALSDEEMAVYKLDPTTFTIISKWTISILNPEGICFSEDGKLLIISDDMEKLFELSIPNQ